MEDLTARSTVTSAPPAETLTSAAQLIISVLPDTGHRIPATRQDRPGRIFTGWVRQWRKR